MIAGGRRQWLLRPVPSPCQGPQGTQAESEEEQAVGLRHRHRVVHAGARIVREGRKDRLGVIARNNMIVGIEVEAGDIADDRQLIDVDRSEEHTSELQSLMRTSYAVFCLKKKTTQIKTPV